MVKKIVSLILAISITLSIAVVSTTTASAAEFTKGSYEFVQQMKVGYNIGNTLDATGGETSWGAPRIEQGYVQAIYKKGFNVIRLPVTWFNCIDSNGNWKDNKAYVNRVKEVVGWIYNTGAYCIVNTHHEMPWLNTYATIHNSDETINETKVSAMLSKFRTLWTNIANEFNGYGERLLFEGYNETRSEEGTWSSVADDQKIITRIGQTFVDAVRATGGNNAKRYIICSTFAAGTGKEIRNYVMPNDSVGHIIFEVHEYNPQSFTFPGPQTNFVESDLNTEIDKAFASVKDVFLSKGYGVILGEFGAVNKNNDAERAKYINALFKKIYPYGIVPIWWDNYTTGVATSVNATESFGINTRTSSTGYTWNFPTVSDALINYANQYQSLRPSSSSAFNTTTTTTTKTTTTTTTKTTTTTTTTTKPAVKGDVTGDGKVNAMDVLAIKRCITNSTFTAVADLSGDGKITSLDILAVKKLIANS